MFHIDYYFLFLLWIIVVSQVAVDVILVLHLSVKTWLVSYASEKDFFFGSSSGQMLDLCCINNPWWLSSSWYKLIENIGCFTVYCLHVVMGIFTVLKIISWKVWWSFLTSGSKKWGSSGFLMLINTMLWIQTCTINSYAVTCQEHRVMVQIFVLRVWRS